MEWGGETLGPELRRPRRADRSRDEEWILEFLSGGEAGVLAVGGPEGPACLPRIFAYDRTRSAVYTHGAHGGELGGTVERAGPAGVPAVLTVFRMGRLLPEEEAGEFGVEYASVVVRGRVSLVADPAEAEHGLALLMEKYAPHLTPGRDYQAITPEEIHRTAVLRMDVTSWSGKEKAAPQDYPGAYRFQDVVRRKLP
jgi:nitroimidazol reductase NimA-like FMN-containing flavoprotein (pyridoxamine 5'-phosphate oxidase superfamily)